ncbi:MAG: HAMP domain-containing sensor histidine kinase [Pseudomonadota bacterium]
MHLSIRVKVFATYALLAILVLAVLFSGLTRLKRIGTRLNIIQGSYLPIVKTINSFFNFYHLNESFDVQRIIANRDNSLFVESVTVASPQLMEQSLRRGMEEAHATLLRNPTLKEERQLARLEELAGAVIEQHMKYVDLIRSILEDIRAGKLETARKRNDELTEQKRTVRARIEFLSHQADQRIQNAIRATAVEERNAVFWQIGLSIATLVLALLIGLVALFSLRPLEKLKAAARQIAAGDLSRRAHVGSKDEIGALATEFNRMADSIQQRDKALHRQQEQLVQSERMAVVGRMASKISHEVRNPLNALGLNLELLNDEVKTDSARKILGAVSKEIDRLNAVAESYLSMSRSKKRAPQETDVGSLLTNLAAFIRPECERKKLELVMSVAPDLPKLRTDPFRLEQAVLNLTRNAMEALQEGQKFGVTARAEDGQILMEVWDEGPGIPQEVLPHIFEPFYTTKEKGTGLGLSVTHDIVREQGGSIECESGAARGTRFIIHLPVSQA